MGVYDVQHNRGGNRQDPGGDGFDPRSVMSEDEEREADQRAYDEQAAGMAEADNQRSALADRIMQAEQMAVKGGNILNKHAAGAGHRLAGKDPNDAPEPEDFDNLYNKEKKAGGGYYQEEDDSKPRPKGFLANVRRKTTKANLIFGALFTLVGIIVGILQTIIQPFQIPTISQFLEDTKYAAFNNAGDRAFEHAFTSYIAAILMPGMRANGCPSTKVARTCTGDLNGDGPIRLLYRKMAATDGKNTSLEYKMAQRGVEIQFNARTGQYYMRSPSMGNGGTTDLPDADCDDRRCANISRLLSDRGISNMFEMRELSRAEVKAEIKRILEDESDHKSLMYRMRVGNMLKKYGIVRCVVACKFKERLHGTRTELNKSGLALINARLFETRASVLGLYLNCMMTPCDDVLSSEGVNADESTMGQASTELHRSQRAVLAALSARFGEQTLKDMVGRINDLNRDGLTLHLTKLAVERIGGALPGDRELTPEAVTKFVGGPLAAVLVAVRIIVLVAQASQLKDMHYLGLSALAVATSELMRSTAHEVKAGQMDSAVLGSITNVYRHGAFNTGPGMDDSPVWERTVASVQNRPAMAFMRTILPQKAYAAAANGASLTYMCTDGKSIFNHQGEAGAARNNSCRELREGLDENALVAAGEFVRETPGLAFIAYAGDAFLSVLDAVIKAFTDILFALVPPLLLLQERINEFIMPIITSLFFKVLPDPLGNFPSGARMMELTILGFERGGSDAAHRLYGGQILTPEQQAVIMGEETQKMQDKFAAMPLKDRLFSPETPYSLTGQVALTAPNDLPSAAREAFAGLLGNPVGKLFGSFASIFTLNKAVAQDFTSRGSMFDVVAHGYPVDHEIWRTDFQTYWDEHCADPEKKQDVAYNTVREDIDDPEMKPYGFIKNDLTNQPVNPQANPCFMLYTMGHFDEEPAAPGQAPAAEVAL